MTGATEVQPMMIIANNSMSRDIVLDIFPFLYLYAKSRSACRMIAPFVGVHSATVLLKEICTAPNLLRALQLR